MSALTLAWLAWLTPAIAAPAPSPKPPAPVVWERIAHELKKDRAARGPRTFEKRLALWGQSLNFDEAAKAEIVPPADLQQIASLAGLEAAEVLEGNRVHAGLEHTYGYLRSTLQTPYGLKRDRWTQGQIEAGLGITPPFWPSDAGAHGTPGLFSRITDLFYEIATRKVSPGHHQKRLLETVSDASSKQELTLQTDLVPFASGLGALLVYSLKDSRDPGLKLITGFPVLPNFVDSLLDPSALGPERPIRLRYNAYHPFFSSSPTRPSPERVGRRHLETL